MADKGNVHTYIPNDDKQDYPLYYICILQLVVETFGHSSERINQTNFWKVTRVVRPTKKKTYHKTLGTSVINSSLSPLSLSLIWRTMRIWLYAEVIVHQTWNSTFPHAITSYGTNITLDKACLLFFMFVTWPQFIPLGNPGCLT